MKRKNPYSLFPPAWNIPPSDISLDIMPVDDFTAITIPDTPETDPVCPEVEKLVELIMTAEITRKIERIVFHCTATVQTATVSAIKRYWTEQLGWRNPGYHIITKPSGEWTYLQDFNLPSNGARGFNRTAIHMSYIGGIGRNKQPKDNRTPEQDNLFTAAYNAFKTRFPAANFEGHYQLANRDCPCFNVPKAIKKWKN